MSWACSSSTIISGATNRPLSTLRLFGGERAHQLGEGAAQLVVRDVLGTDPHKGRERLEQTLMHAARTGLERVGRVGQLLKGVEGVRHRI